ncbi:zinc ribbon domain-containing protein [Streptomyces sp. NPDC053079]|uniref:zinc ribbon domain-containing protein n=1 Tax=Streptomyces sp. NPDC053079 TaxID=3365697 RepID=UPI0037CFF171
MPSFCPACGSAFEPDARFCMKCGKERPEAERAAAGATAAGTATAPVMPPSPPPPVAPPAPPGRPPLPGAPPGYAPYAPPSRGALFLRRAFTGDWAGSAKAAAWPAALLLVLALVISLPSPGDYEELGLTSWSDRFPAAIGLLLQGLGATLEVETRSGGGLLTMLVRGSGSVSVWPLTITALWAGAVALGAKRLRRTLPAGSGGGAEATLRIALICAGAVLLLGLYGQPDLEIVSVSTTPVLAALFSGALAGVVGGAVLCRDALAARLGAGAQLAVRAWGTALRALGLSVALCGVIVFFVIASHPDETGDWAWAGSLPFLINLGLMALGLSWGAGVEGSSTEHGRHTGETLGLSEIGDLAGGWAQAGAVAAGVACAVILAVTVARRAADRTEQVLSGVFFLATLWLLSFVSGGAMEMTTGTSFSSRSQGTDGSVATNAGELLLFGLLWTAGALLLATALSHSRGPGSMPRTGPSAPPAPPAQPMPPLPPMPTAGAQPMPPGGAQSAAPTAQPAWPPASAAPAAGTKSAAAAAPAAGTKPTASAAPAAGAQAAGAVASVADSAARAAGPGAAQTAAPGAGSAVAGQAAALPVPAAGTQPTGAAARAAGPGASQPTAPVDGQPVPAAGTKPTASAAPAAGAQAGGAVASVADSAARAAGPGAAQTAAPGADSAVAGQAAAQPAPAAAAPPAGTQPTAPAAGAQAAGAAASAAGSAASAASPAAAQPAPPAGAQSAAPSPTVEQPASPAGAQPPSSAAQPAAQPAPAGGPAGAQPVAHSAVHPSAPAAQPAPFAAHPAGPATAQHDVFAPAPSPHSSFAHLTVPVPVPAAPARSVRRPLMWVAIGLAAFLVGGAATAGVMLLGNGKNSGGGEEAKAPASQSQAPSGGPTGGDGASGAPSASASARPGSKPRPPKGEPPKGYQRMTSPEGFSLAVPESWRRENKGTNQIDYAGPTGPGHIRVGIVPNAGASAYDHFQEMEKSVGKQEGYQRVQMTANTFMGRPGALWEWTWREKNGEVMHALNQAYVDENGTEYAVMYSERERFYPDARKVFDTALQFWWVGPYGVS